MANRERDRTSIYVERDLFRWLQHRAVDKDISASAYISEVLERHRAEVEQDEAAREAPA